MKVETTSLRAVIEDLCWRADVQLRAFDADDRLITAGYGPLPLYELFERLLREESYFIGLRASSADQGPRVAWLRVVGDHVTAAENRAASAVKGSRSTKMIIPSTLIRTAFGSTDPKQREEALAVLERQIVDEPARLEAFLAEEPEFIARLLARYPRAAEVLESVSRRQKDETLRRKIDQILDAINARRARSASRRRASRSGL